MHIRPGDRRPMDKSAIAQVLRYFDKRCAAPTIDTPIHSSGVTDPPGSRCFRIADMKVFWSSTGRSGQR